MAVIRGPSPLGTIGEAWRGGDRAWPATIAVWVATLFLTPDVFFGFVWFIVVTFITFSNGTLMVVPLTIPTFMLYTVLLCHCLPRKFMGTPWSVTLGLVISLLAFLTIPVQYVVIWPGLFDGTATVPFYTPMVYLQLSDPFWPYLLLAIGNLMTLIAIFASFLAFGLSAGMYVFVFITNKLPNPGWIVGGFRKFAKITPFSPI